jgi:hypothetical protein
MLATYFTILLFLAHSALSAVEFKHHNNTEMAAVMQQIHNACPDITRLYTLSETSVNGIPLYVLEITDNPGRHEPSKNWLLLPLLPLLLLLMLLLSLLLLLMLL